MLVPVRERSIYWDCTVAMATEDLLMDFLD